MVGQALASMVRERTMERLRPSLTPEHGGCALHKLSIGHVHVIHLHPHPPCT